MNLLLKLKLKQELKKLNVSNSNITIIQSKDGVIVARVQVNATSYIIKYFQKDEHKREIKNYKILFLHQQYAHQTLICFCCLKTYKTPFKICSYSKYAKYHYL